MAAFRFDTRARMFLAVMAAACVGNLYYHLVLRDFHKYFLVAPYVALDRMASQVTYSVLLGLLIFASMRREQARRGRSAATGGALRRVRAIAGVWMVFGMLQIWLVDPTGVTYGERARFCLGLVGITGAADARASAPLPATREGTSEPHENGT